MLTLKDIGSINSLLGNSPLSQSPLWRKPVDKIAPAQLTAFRTKLAIEGRATEADAIIQTALNEVMTAVKTGDIQLVSMLDYVEPNDSIITAGQLQRGFKSMTHPRPAAILFGLETGTSAEQVITLTWSVAKKLRADRLLTPYACRILDSQPVHIHSRYVFWQQINNKPMPLFGLAQEVFDTFNMVWGELASAYSNIVLVDEAVELARWQDLLLMVRK